MEKWFKAMKISGRKQPGLFPRIAIRPVLIMAAPLLIGYLMIGE